MTGCQKVLLLGAVSWIFAAGCAGEGPSASPDPAITATPDFPAAGTESDPGSSDSGTTEPADVSAPPAKITASRSVDIVQVAASDVERLVAENEGKAVLFDFWATWCVPCVEQYPHTVELSERYADDLTVFTVSMDENDDESLAAVQRFHAKLGLGKIRPLISSSGGAEEAYESFDITGGALPHYKIFDRDGRLSSTLGGDVDDPIEPAKIDAAVAKALGE